MEKLKQYWRSFLGWQGWRTFGALCVRGWRASASFCIKAWKASGPFWGRLFAIGPVMTLLLAVLCGGGLLLVFLRGWEQTIPAYLLFALSAYTLTALVIRLPGMLRKANSFIHSDPRLERLVTDKSLKFSLGLVFEQMVNFGYGVFKIGSGVFYGSAWIGADGIYNLAQGVIQLFQILRRRKPLTMIRQWKSYRLCGWLMLMLHLTMTGLIFQMVNWGRSEDYPGHMIFATAAFAFYKLITAFVDVAQDRKHTQPVDSAVRLLDLSQAFFSLFSLQVSLLHAFGTGEVWETWANGATGAVVCMLVVGMGVYMIRRANREIKKITGET